MNDNLSIQQLLDDVWQQKIDRTSAAKNIAALGIENAFLEIDVHLAAAKAIQRHNVIQQVQAVHLRFTNDETNTAVPTEQTRLVKMSVGKGLLRIAAAAILVLGLFLGYEYTSTNSNNIYSVVYQPYEVNTSRSNEGELPTHNMLQEFRKQEYAAVIKTFATLRVTNNREKFLTAYAYHETQQFQTAVTLLQSILQYNRETNSRLYNDEAEFYLGLSFLKMKNIEQSLKYFEPIAADPDHTFHDRVGRWTLIKLKWLK